MHLATEGIATPGDLSKFNIKGMWDQIVENCKRSPTYDCESTECASVRPTGAVSTTGKVTHAPQECGKNSEVL